MASDTLVMRRITELAEPVGDGADVQFGRTRVGCNPAFTGAAVRASEPGGLPRRVTVIPE